MLERIILLATEGHLLAVEGGWFSTNWHNLIANFTEKCFFDAMLNPYMIALSVVLLLFAIFSRSKPTLMLLIAVWGYSTVYHFTIESKKAGVDYESVQIGDFGTLVWFFAGFILVTAVLLYLGFIKGD